MPDAQDHALPADSEDVTLAEFGNYRYLTVGPALQPDIHFILGVPGPPVHDPGTAARR